MSVVILKPLLSRLKDLGEPRKASRFMRRINRAFDRFQMQCPI